MPISDISLEVKQCLFQLMAVNHDFKSVKCGVNLFHRTTIFPRGRMALDFEIDDYPLEIDDYPGIPNIPKNILTEIFLRY